MKILEKWLAGRFARLYKERPDVLEVVGFSLVNMAFAVIVDGSHGWFTLRDGLFIL